MDVFVHHRLRRDVEAYVDGELDPVARARVRRHVAVCWECSVAAETVRLLKAALRRHRRREPATVAERRVRRFAEQLAGRP